MLVAFTTFTFAPRRDACIGLERNNVMHRVSMRAESPLTDHAHRIHQCLCELRTDLVQFQKARNDIQGVSKMLRRLDNDLRVMRSIIRGEESMTCTKLQGMKNNADGIRAELLTAEQAPEVTAVGKRFYSDGVPRGVEVDVVAQKGSLWIEVKKHQSFSTGSRMWGGRKGTKGILQQAQEVAEVAKQEHNFVWWRAPRVAFRFIGKVDESVREELEALGVMVLVDDGVLDVGALPECPKRTDQINLDVTTLCCLVSEVSNGGAFSDEVNAWARKNPQYSNCVEEEKLEPVLPSLLREFEGRRLVVSEHAYDKFNQILKLSGGDRENFRWETQWRDRISCTRGTEGDNLSASHRVSGLRGTTEHHKIVFGYGDLIQATTATANAKFVRSASAQGVNLDVLVHRPVFLTGL